MYVIFSTFAACAPVSDYKTRVKTGLHPFTKQVHIPQTHWILHTFGKNREMYVKVSKDMSVWPDRADRHSPSGQHSANAQDVYKRQTTFWFELNFVKAEKMRNVLSSPEASPEERNK